MTAVYMVNLKITEVNLYSSAMTNLNNKQISVTEKCIELTALTRRLEIGVLLDTVSTSFNAWFSRSCSLTKGLTSLPLLIGT